MTATVATLPAQAATAEAQAPKLPQRAPLFALTPQTLDEAMQFAGMMSKSSIVPKDYQGNPGNILVAVQWGAEIGLAPLQAMQSIAVINGRPSIWGDAMLALVRGSGLLEYIREEPTDEGCTCTLKRRGDPHEVERIFTVEDAKKAGLWGKQGPWQQHPKRMMQMRARAFALRDTFPDVLRGVHVGEEAQDLPPVPTERHMGEADEVKPDAPRLPPASRADKTREALAKRKQQAQAGTPALADVIAAIGQAETAEALKAAAELASHLADESAKAAAREAYAERKEALAAAAAPPADDKPTARTYAQIAEAIKGATSAETAALELDAARDAGLPGDQLDDLGALYRRTWEAN